jgi:hypothetical protein
MNVAMNVFVSYSRKDESLVHLLSYILAKTGIRCLLDRDLIASYPFDAGLKNMIEDSDVVLVLLTKASDDFGMGEAGSRLCRSA